MQTITYLANGQIVALGTLVEWETSDGQTISEPIKQRPRDVLHIQTHELLIAGTLYFRNSGYNPHDYAGAKIVGTPPQKTPHPMETQQQTTYGPLYNQLQRDAYTISSLYTGMSVKALEFICNSPQVHEHELRYKLAYAELLRRHAGYIDTDALATEPEHVRRAVLAGVRKNCASCEHASGAYELHSFDVPRYDCTLGTGPEYYARPGGFVCGRHEYRALRGVILQYKPTK